MIQLRLNGFVDFNHTWDDYKRGFGNFLIGKYWLELEKIRRLTGNKLENNLRVDMGVTNDTTVAEYAWIKIGRVKYKYQLNIENLISKLANYPYH